jgi:cytochrome c oxidase cbb3-type subunit IV
MFKFIRQYAEKINDAQVYPIISLIIFFLFFTVLLVLVIKMRKENVELLSNLPLDKEETANSNL